MKTLTLEEIRPLLHGALYVREENGGLTARRYTEKQLAFYDAYKPGFGMKARATAAMRLTFDTNTTAARFTFRTHFGGSRLYCTFDITVDGNLVATPAHNNVEGTEFSFAVPAPYLDGKTHRVCVYLPNLWAADVLAVCVSDGASVTPVQKTRKLLSLGDSVTQGYDAQRPSQSYVNLLADELCAEVVNNAIGGDVFQPESLDPAYPYVPDVITVGYGSNDWTKCTRDKIERDVPAYYRRLREIFPAATIFAITPIWRDACDVPKQNGFVLTDVSAIIREAAAAVGAHVIDGMLLVPHIPEFFYDRRLHPNDEGFAHYARHLLRAMRPYL